MSFCHMPPSYRRPDNLITAVVTLLLILFATVALSGCSGLDKLPAGTQLQSSTFGLKFSPQAPDGTPFVLGSHTAIITTAQPADGGPNVNRYEVQAPFGTRLKSTVASGPVGEQFAQPGLVQAIEALSASPNTTPPATIGRLPPPVATLGEPASE